MTTQRKGCPAPAMQNFRTLHSLLDVLFYESTLGACPSRTIRIAARIGHLTPKANTATDLRPVSLVMPKVR